MLSIILLAWDMSATVRIVVSACSCWSLIHVLVDIEMKELFPYQFEKIILSFSILDKILYEYEYINYNDLWIHMCTLSVRFCYTEILSIISSYLPRAKPTARRAYRVNTIRAVSTFQRPRVNFEKINYISEVNRCLDLVKK